MHRPAPSQTRNELTTIGDILRFYTPYGSAYVKVVTNTWSTILRHNRSEERAT